MFAQTPRAGPVWVERLAALAGISGPGRAIRHRRRFRLAVSLAVGLVWSVCLMTVLAQLGVSRYLHHGRLPWWTGIIVGFALSMVLSQARRTVRSARVRFMARRSALAGLVMAAGLVGMWRAEPAAAAEADEARDCNVRAQLVVGDGSPGEEVLLADTSRDRPFAVDPDLVTAIIIDWDVSDRADIAGRRWWVWAEVHGMRHTVAEKVAGVNDSGRYTVPIERLRARPPGVIPVGGEFDGICREETGYLRIVGSPLDNGIGFGASVGLVVLSAGLVLLRRPSSLDLWWFETPNRIEVRIIDPTAGRPASGPLLRGGIYHAEVTVRLPRTAAPSTIASQAIRVVAGSLGAAMAPSASGLNVRAGRGMTRLRFQLPTEDQPFQLQVDVHAGGRVIESVQLRETAEAKIRSVGATVNQGVGHVTYSAGDLAKEVLSGAEPVDATIMVHGSASGDLIETWVVTGEAGGRQVARHRILIADLVDASDQYRNSLEQAAGTAARSTRGAAASAPATTAMAEVASAGAEFRRRLLGSGSSGVPFGGRLVIAADLDAIDSLTVPLGGIYEGSVIPGELTTVCTTFEVDPDACAGHGLDVVCPTRFWGFRHELIWPRNRAAGIDQPLPVTDRLVSLLRRAWPARGATGSSSTPPPVQAIKVVASGLAMGAARSPLASLVAGPGGWSTSTRRGLLTTIAGSGAGCDLVYLLAHGGVDNPEDLRSSPTVVRQAYTLALDDGLLGERELEQLEAGALARGPIVMINACRSGVIERGAGDDFVEAWFRLGASGVVVTETKVGSDTAAELAALVVHGLVDGNSLSRSLLLTRWAYYSATGSLAGLVYSCYGAVGSGLPGSIRNSRRSGV